MPHYNELAVEIFLVLRNGNSRILLLHSKILIYPIPLPIGYIKYGLVDDSFFLSC